MGTKSEALFEEFLASNGVSFSRIEEVRETGERRPDYLVEVGSQKMIFEVKQLGDDQSAEHAQRVGSWSATPGDALRRLIKRSKAQLQFGASQGTASALIVYNNSDPVFQTRGTDAFDFRAAMYGELTMLIRRSTNETSEFFHG